MLSEGTAIGPQGRIVLKSELGHGASGSVWHAYDSEKEREVAVKFLHGEAFDHASTRERFLREGQRFGQLRHENLVQVLGLGWWQSRPYIVLEYVAGRTLWDLLEDGFLFEPDEALIIARDVASGLSVAHEAGVIHRDLKPSNIMVRAADRTVKVLDFGIAKDLHASAITRIGTYLGTPAYSSPEQIMGGAVDARSDIYSLGVILYELLTGPISADDRRTTELFQDAMAERNIPLSELHTRVSRPVALLIQRMTRRSPDRRPASMQQVREECSRLLGILRGDLAGGDATTIRQVLRDLFEG